jgi:magnesium-protoporphyrin O-methyltransferase
MRATLLDWLGSDLRGRRLLDAGCGTGALAIEAARRGAEVVAIDLSATMVGLARERAPTGLAGGAIDFRVGDMADAALGRFDHVVAMDSLIHYPAAEIVRLLAQWAPRTARSMLVTFAPQTPALSAMHAVGRLFPRANRAPAIEPVAPARFAAAVREAPALAAFEMARAERVASGFYTSQAQELVRGAAVDRKARG